MTNNVLLIDFLRQRETLTSLPFEPKQLELLLRQARYANVLSHIACFLQSRNLLTDIPHPIRQHFENAIVVADAHKRSALWEVKCIYKVLRAAGVDLCLLKGCAYIWTGNVASPGRLLGDIDILVPKAQLFEAETAFAHGGWVPTKLDAYDQKYYRQWMHEIPPLHHTTRHTNLDVHHTILPPIMKTGFSIDALWERMVEDPQYPGLKALALEDMIIHSAVHLFHEGEFPNGLRDLVDLDALLRDYAKRKNPWDDLLARGRDLDVHVSLYYALNYTKKILDTPIPEAIIEKSRDAAGISTSGSKVMDWFFLASLIPDHQTCKPFAADVARWGLYLRSHWLRMPLHTLIPHLIRKSLKL